MDSEKNYLGIDGGASKTTATLIDEKRNILGQGKSGGSNINVLGPTKSLKNIKSAVKQALKNKNLKNIVAVFALAGVGNPDDEKGWRKQITNDTFFSQIFAKPPKFFNDTQAALRSGTTDKNAIALIAGTGSNCWGHNQEGKEAKSGGADYILGDQGSGYDIGLKILKNVTKSLDGRANNTQLAGLLMDHLKINSLQDLIDLVYKEPWNKGDVAKIAPLIETAANNNDKVAQEIIEEAVTDLSQMVKSVANKLDLTNKPYVVVSAGSIFKIKKLREGVEKEVKKFSPNAKFEDQKVDSATAAAYLALESNIN